jgi:hypothetical protein
MKGIGADVVEGDAVGSAVGEGLGVYIGQGRGIESEDRESRVLGADFLHKMEPFEIPGVYVQSNGMTTTVSERAEKIRERTEAVKMQGGSGVFSNRFREFGPSRVFAKEKKFNRVLHLHWSY